MNPPVKNCRSEILSNGVSKNFLSDESAVLFCGRGVEIFAAIAKEFPAIFHQREIFLCQAFF